MTTDKLTGYGTFTEEDGITDSDIKAVMDDIASRIEKGKTTFQPTHVFKGDWSVGIPEAQVKLLSSNNGYSLVEYEDGTTEELPDKMLMSFKELELLEEVFKE